MFRTFEFTGFGEKLNESKVAGCCWMKWFMSHDSLGCEFMCLSALKHENSKRQKVNSIFDIPYPINLSAKKKSYCI